MNKLLSKKTVSILLAGLMAVGALSGCAGGKGKKGASSFDDSKIVDFNKYHDSEDIPDWDGDKLELTLWSRASETQDSTIGKTSQYNCVANEAERVTGVKLSDKNSFDNAGGSADSRIAKMIATNNYPDIANGIPDITGLVQKGVLYRLDEYIEKYAPTVYKLFGPNSKIYGDEWNRQIKTFGGVYSISLSGVHSTVRDITEIDGNYDLSEEQLASAAGVGTSPYGSFYIREDILKQLYPDAKTSDELKAIFEKNGGFTQEEIFDVPIESSEDFIELLYKTKDILDKSGEKETSVMYTHNGTDNWYSLTTFGNIMGYNGNYFSYWDKETSQIKYTYKEDWFKDILKTWNKLIKDEVASKEALIDTSANFNEKLNSGKYIISLTKPSNEDNYKYRRVWVRYAFNQDKFVSFKGSDALAMRISVFNKNINEAQLIQTLRYIEFMTSDPGQKITYWGTKSMGLYEEDEDGNLRYTDKALETEMLMGNSTDQRRKYGLSSYWPAPLGVSASKFLPKLYYTEVSDYNSVYNPAVYERVETVTGVSANIYENSFTSKIEGVKKFWSARQGFEDAMQKIFASTDDASFEANYKEMLDYAESNGLTDEVLKECNEYYENDLNKDYMKYLK